MQVQLVGGREPPAFSFKAEAETEARTRWVAVSEGLGRSIRGCEVMRRGEGDVSGWDYDNAGLADRGVEG